MLIANDLPGQSAIAEFLRPWKLVTLAAGIALLIAGSYLMPAPDWGIPDSILLAMFAYATAPLVVRWWLERRWDRLPVALLFAWLGSAGIYQAWWLWRDPRALMLMSDAAIPANLALYLMCGLFWLYRGSLAAWVSDCRGAVHALLVGRPWG